MCQTLQVKVPRIINTNTFCPGAWMWTLYPRPVLNVRDQHSQSGFHSIPQELVCLPLPGRGKRKHCVSGSKAWARCYTVYSALVRRAPPAPDETGSCVSVPAEQQGCSVLPSWLCLDWPPGDSQWRLSSLNLSCHPEQ